MEDLSNGYEAHAVFSLLLVRMIMRLRLHVRGVDRFGLKLEPDQFGRRASRTFELRRELATT